MRRLLSAFLGALLVVGLLPGPAFAAAPVAADLTPSTDEDTPVAITLSATHDVDEPVTEFAISSAGEPASGSLGAIGSITCQAGTCTADVTYTPDEDSNGTDGFQYTATSIGGTSAPATVTVTVNPVNDLPSFSVGDAQTVGEDAGAQSVAGFITDAIPGPATATDEAGQQLSFELLATHASLFSAQPQVSAAGTLSFTPAANRFGTTSVAIALSDGTDTTADQSFDITITPVNDPVDARSDAVFVNATTTTTLDLFKVNGGGADSAGPGESSDDLVITAVSKPAKGTVAITDAGRRVRYDPIRCAYGSDTFTYTLSDGQYTDTATVVVTIARPGQNGLSTNPITDTPTTAFITGSTESSTIPVKLSWCGVTASTASVKGYRVDQSTNGGTSYGSVLYSSTTGSSSTRKLAVSTNYRWRARTTDTANRIGAFKYSLVSRITRYQNTSSALAYAGSWGTTTTSSASGGSLRWTTQAGASATITVKNVRSFAIVGTRSSTRGSFRVYVDNVLVATISARSSTTAYRRVLYVRNVTSGVGVNHVVRIEAVGNGRVDLDAILTMATP